MPQRTKGGAKFSDGTNEIYAKLLKLAAEIRTNARRYPAVAEEAARDIETLVNKAYQLLRDAEPLLERQAPQYEARLAALEEFRREIEAEGKITQFPSRKEA